jgi:hypothetical protein
LLDEALKLVAGGTGAPTPSASKAEAYVPSLFEKRSRSKSLERLEHRGNEKPNLPAADRGPSEHGSTRMPGDCLEFLPADTDSKRLRQRLVKRSTGPQSVSLAKLLSVGEIDPGGTRKGGLDAFLDQKVAEGYRVETRTNTHAIISRRPKGLKRFTSGEDPGRYVVEVDEDGRATMRAAEPRRT